MIFVQKSVNLRHHLMFLGIEINEQLINLTH